MEKIWRWKNGILQKQNSLLEGLQITEKEVISVVGAGGKTTTIRRLADEMEKRQKRVAVTTTTRMKKEAQFLLAADFERITQQWKKSSQVWFAEQDEHPQKVKGVSEEVLDQVRKAPLDLILIEADGARELPCKVPETWEPVIYPKSTRVLAVYGLDAVGERFLDVCFRPELAAEILKKNIADRISAQDLARLALDVRGGKKGVKEHMRYQVILNKADTQQRKKAAEEICRELEKSGFTDVTVTAEGRQEET